jgi:hypothetical protein
MAAKQGTDWKWTVMEFRQRGSGARLSTRGTKIGEAGNIFIDKLHTNGNILG